MRKQILLQSLLLASTVVATSTPYRVHRRQPQTNTNTAASTPSPSVGQQPSATPTATPSATPSASSTATSGNGSSTQESSASSTTTSPGSSTSTPASSTDNSQTSSMTSAASISESAITTKSVSTASDGQMVTLTVTTTTPIDASATSPTPSPTNNPHPNDPSGVGTGTIVGLSVAGGIAVLAIVAFIIWKLTRKRFSDLDDEPNEAIKWPELNHDAHTVGGTSTTALSREPSNAYAASSVSRDHFDTSSDPYAVPPLPQFNPNQPYRDDPHAAASAGFYDPYSGPVPHTFQDDALGGESIPMNTYPPSGRTRSPGPGMAYDVGGRGSPAPGRIGTPGVGPVGPVYDAGGRASPVVGRASPGPQYALGGQPEMARYHSPAPYG